MKRARKKIAGDAASTRHCVIARKKTAVSGQAVFFRALSSRASIIRIHPAHHPSCTDAL
jgi:hypothetical protein